MKRKCRCEKQAAQVEYIVWGIPSGRATEEPLFTRAETMEEAKGALKICSSKFGAKKCRIQVLDLSTPPDFRNVFK